MSHEDLQSLGSAAAPFPALQVPAASVSLNVQPSPRLKAAARFCAGPCLHQTIERLSTKACVSLGPVDGPGKAGFRDAFN